MKKIAIYLSAFCLMIVFVFTLMHIFKNDSLDDTKSITGTVISIDNDTITLQDNKNVIYTFYLRDVLAEIGSNVAIEYTGLLDKNTAMQRVDVIKYSDTSNKTDENGIPTSWLDNGIFSDYYIQAFNKLKTLTLDEKIGQLLLVRYPDNNAKEILEKYKLSGYVFFEKDFKDKTKAEVQKMINDLQKVSKIPLLTAVDEEGGKVVRVSSNPNLVDEKFKSSKELYNIGGFNAIKQDTIDKSKILNNLGLNVNLAPVVDVSTDPSNYIYERSFGKDTDLTSKYAKTVIEASKGTGVSYVLKHFPGYGNNSDTHQGSSLDNRTLENIIKYDLPPFESGIEVGAEAVLVSHNVISSIDPDNPASLSASVHNLLRNDLDFTGIIITDSLDMAALSSTNDVIVKALLAGNDLIITTDYEEAIREIKDAINDGVISEELIDKLAFRILSWKCYKGLMYEASK